MPVPARSAPAPWLASRHQIGSLRSSQMLQRASGAATAKCRSRSASLFVCLGADGRPPATSLLQREAEFTILPNGNDAVNAGSRFRQMTRNGALCSEPQIDHFVMAITSAEAEIWH